MIQVNRLIRIPILFLAAWFIQGCAHITPLGGGTKDNDPPKVIKIVPKQKEVNVVGKNIEIEFDEYIVLRDVPNQVSIIPTLRNAPEITSKGKKINITLKDQLDANTTYTIRFGEAITDLHDGNVLSGFEYCFSTGNTIDSFSVQGKVRDAFTNYPAKDTWVYLYKTMEDSIVYKEKPYYYSRCDEDGGYKISNVKPGSYKIIALNDKNKNFTYEQSEESIGFLNNAIRVNADSTEFNLVIFKEEPSRTFVKKIVQPISGKALIILSRTSISPQLTPYYSKTALGADRILNFESNDTLVVWYKNINDDTLRYILKDRDLVIDTISIISPSQKKTEKEFSSGKFKVSVEKYGHSFPAANQFSISFNHPIMIVDTSKITLISSKKKNASINLKPDKFSFGNQKLRSESDYYNTWTSNINYEFEATYDLLILPGAIKNYFDVTNDTIKHSFTTGLKENYGRLLLTLTMDSVNSSTYIFQLLDSKMKVIYEVEVLFTNNESVLIIPYLLGDTYSTRLIIDSNHDHQFTSGNYINHILPEKIIDGAVQIKILSDWDTENKWKIAR